MRGDSVYDVHHANRDGWRRRSKGERDGGRTRRGDTKSPLGRENTLGYSIRAILSPPLVSPHFRVFDNE